jgi:hypothetical protein
MMYCVLYNNAVLPFKCEGWHFTNMWKAFFSGDRVTRSLVVYVCFVDRPFILFCFGHCVVCFSSTYE